MKEVRKRRLMVIKYQDESFVNRLKTCLDMCCIPYVVMKECEFVDGSFLWTFFIDRGKCTWEQVMKEVNRVYPVKFNFVNDRFIENGKLVVPLNY